MRRWTPPGGAPPGGLELPCEQAGREWAIHVEVGRNDDPAGLGCPDFARGFPWCRATIEPAARDDGQLDQPG